MTRHVAETSFTFHPPSHCRYIQLFHSPSAHPSLCLRSLEFQANLYIGGKCLLRNLQALFRSDLLAGRGPRNNKNSLDAFAFNFWILCVAKCHEWLSALEPTTLVEGEPICEICGLALALLTTQRNNTIYCSPRFFGSIG